MKKRSAFLVVLVVFLLFLTGCGDSSITRSVENVDKSTRIVTTTQPGETGEVNYSTYELEYIKDGKKYTTWWSPRLRPALDFLKASTRPDEKILTWWDNGHIIRGYVRREPLVYTPTKDILDTVAGDWDEEEMGTLADRDLMVNIAYAFLADSPKITTGIMNRYDTRWVFVARIDEKKIAGMVKLVDEDMKNYLDELGDAKATVRHKTIFQMADGWPVKGFEREYEDEYATVYRLQE